MSAARRPYDLTLTVIETYTVAVDGGGVETRENRVSGKTTVHVNDSPTEVSGLAFTFLDDFIHSERSPEFCVRNFSDSCAGKQAELSDVRANRAMFIIDPSRSSVGFGPPSFYDTDSVTRRQPVPAGASVFRGDLRSVQFCLDEPGDSSVRHRNRAPAS